MKFVNRSIVNQHDERRTYLSDFFDNAKSEALAEHENNAPKPVTLKQHPEGKTPLELAPGVTVMAGDYYNEDPPFVVPAHAVGKGKDWEPVK